MLGSDDSKLVCCGQTPKTLGGQNCLTLNTVFANAMESVRGKTNDE